MSHTVKINTKFTRLDPLKTAFAAFGWTITEKSKARTYSSDIARNTVYDYVAVNPRKEGSPFDVGINVKNNELELFWDPYGGSIVATLGENMDKLKAEYAYRVIEEEYTYQGAAVLRTINADGTQNVDVEFTH